MSIFVFNLKKYNKLQQISSCSFSTIFKNSTNSLFTSKQFVRNIYKTSKNKQINKSVLKKKYLVKYKTRKLVRDPVYQSKLINAFLNVAMKNGERRVVERIIYRYLFLLNKNKILSLFLFFKFVSKTLVPISLQSVRVGGRIYEVPFYTWWHRRLFFSYNLLLSSRYGSKKSNFSDRLFTITKDFLTERHGGLMGRRLRVIYRKLVRSRGYLHYRWY
jgi:ribosomal protein S7